MKQLLKRKRFPWPMKTKVGSLKVPWALYMGVEKGKAEEVEGEVRKCKISPGKQSEGRKLLSC